MQANSRSSNKDVANALRQLTKTNYLIMGLIVIMIGFFAYQSFFRYAPYTPGNQTTTTTTISGKIGFGNTIAGIDTPFNSTELAVINNGSNNYFEMAGQMLLNGSLSNFVYNKQINRSYASNGFVSNGKPSVIYIGALSCIYCGENRWAMALALSRFGGFTALYHGYSSFGDYDVPTIYWSQLNYTVQSGTSYGNSYHSNYISFISAEYESPVTGGFQMQPLSYFIMGAPNASYRSAMEFMNGTNDFQGTPFTLWGNIIMPGADAVVFGNSTPTNNTLALTYMTHKGVLQLIGNFNSQFAYSEYAAADVYAAFLCSGMKNPPNFCSLPAITSIEKLEGV